MLVALDKMLTTSVLLHGKGKNLQCCSDYTRVFRYWVPYITWKDSAGNSISNGGRYSLTDGRRLLTIANLTEDDDGETYTCEVSNTLGRSQASMVLNVTCM